MIYTRKWSGASGILKFFPSLLPFVHISRWLVLLSFHVWCVHKTSNSRRGFGRRQKKNKWEISKFTTSKRRDVWWWWRWRRVEKSKMLAWPHSRWRSWGSAGRTESAIHAKICGRCFFCSSSIAVLCQGWTAAVLNFIWVLGKGKGCDERNYGFLDNLCHFLTTHPVAAAAAACSAHLRCSSWETAQEKRMNESIKEDEKSERDFFSPVLSIFNIAAHKCMHGKSRQVRWLCFCWFMTKISNFFCSSILPLGAFILWPGFVRTMIECGSAGVEKSHKITFFPLHSVDQLYYIPCNHIRISHPAAVFRVVCSE